MKCQNDGSFKGNFQGLNNKSIIWVFDLFLAIIIPNWLVNYVQILGAILIIFKRWV